MASSLPLVTEAPTKDYRAMLRIWHWLNALLISGLLLTILFQKVIVNASSAVPAFLAQLQRDNVHLTQRQGRVFAHLISERIWQWHIYLGLGLAACWLVRVGLELRGPSPMRYSARLLEIARRYRLAPAASRGEWGEVLFAKSTYAIFYLLLTIMVSTGLVLTWASKVPALRGAQPTAEQIHGVTMYGISAFFVLHVVGVVRAELTKDHGLISRMVGGRSQPSRGEV